MKEKLKMIKWAIAILGCCSLILAALICLNTSEANAADSDTDAELSVNVDKTDIHAGDVINVKISLDKNAGLSAVRFNMLYDTSTLELMSIATEYDEDEGADIIVSALSNPTVNPDPTSVSQANINSEANGSIAYVWALEKNRTKTGVLLDMQFKVKSDAKIGDTAISIENLDFSKTDANDSTKVLKANAVATGADIEIQCSHSKTTTEISKAATCTEDGVQIKKCTICGKTLDTQVITKLGHAYGEYTVTKEPTCTEAGKETANCTRCGTEDEKEIAALGHEFGEYKVTKEPTCTEAGKETANCTRCGAEDEKEIAALGHEFGEYKVTKEPTCTEAGKETAECSRCDAVEEREIAALGHVYDKYEIVKDATDTEDGEMLRTCGVCGQTITTVIPKVSAESFTISDEKGNELKTSYSANEKIIFLASVYGENSKPAVGDMCYVPIAWKLGDVETRFEEGNYTAEITPDKAGDYNIEVVYERRFYESAETGWKADGKTFTYMVKITVEETQEESSGNNSEADSTAKADKDSSATGDSPTTGDSTGNAVVMLVAIALAAAGIIAGSRKIVGKTEK